jgi:pimeloyl-ACP methyl ester carboxylesterase
VRIALALLLLLARDEFKDATARITRAANQRDYNELPNAFLLLPKADARTPKFLFDLVKGSDFWIKGKFVSALADAAHQDALLQEIETGKRKDVREVCLLALETLDGPPVVAALAKALNDSDPRIRRAATLSLGAKVSRERADALVARLAEEKDRAVQVHIVARLESWTKQKFGAKSADWAAWWKVHREEPIDPVKAEEGEIEFEGFTLKHETRVMDRKDAGIVVLPDYAARPDPARPYLDFLMTFGALHYVRLPDPKQFSKEKSPNGKPVYPVDSMLSALEALRTEFKEQKLVLVSHGLTGWLAMAYAHKYEGNVAALILLGAHVDDESFLAAAARARAEGNRRKESGLEALGSYSQGNFTDWTPALTVAKLTTFVMDGQELILNRVLENYWEDWGGPIVIPDLKKRRSVLQTPTLFVFGKFDPFSGANEFNRAKSVFPAATALTFDQSGALPYLTEPEKFEKAVSELLSRVLKKR